VPVSSVRRGGPANTGSTENKQRNANANKSLYINYPFFTMMLRVALLISV